MYKGLSAAVLMLAAVGGVSAAPGTTNSQYVTTNDAGRVEAVVIQQSTDGTYSAPINSSNPLPVGFSSTLTLANSQAVESSHIFKASAGNLYGFHVTNGSSTGYVMFFDATSVPADGAVIPALCIAMPSVNSTIGGLIQPFPLRFTKGIVAAYSTTGCFTKTSSATAFFAAQVQ